MFLQGNYKMVRGIIKIYKFLLDLEPKSLDGVSKLFLCLSILYVKI
jgi:hypothetical protein